MNAENNKINIINKYKTAFSIIKYNKSIVRGSNTL